VNVLVLSHMFPGPSGASKGIFVREQVKALESLGVRCTVLAPTPWKPYARRDTERFAEDNAGLQVQYPSVLSFPRAAFFSISGVLYYLAVRRSALRAIHDRRIDLIHAHAIMPDGFAAVLLGRELRLPVACTLHGSDVKLYPARSRAIAAATRWALRRIPSLIAVSEDVGRAALSLGAAQISRTIHNGADPELFHPASKSAAKAKLALPGGERIVLFVGNLISLKGAHLLLRAVAALPYAVRLVFVGDGPLRAELQRTAVHLGVRASFAGARPHSEIPLWLNAADCLVLPSLSEGLPTIVAEAMLCRTPVVATAVGGTPEIVRNGETGHLVPPADPVALTAAIAASLAMSSAQRETQLDRAQQLAQHSLTWEVNARRTLAVYQQTLGVLTTEETPLARIA
jgi:glycosyltransferase involved in cell wall biosynthesis